MRRSRLGSVAALGGARMPETQAAIVTGGGRGIGQAVAHALARDGFRLVLVARTTSELERVAGEIRRRGGEARTVSADVSHSDDAARIARAALDAYGGIDVLVNAAGVY